MALGASSQVISTDFDHSVLSNLAVSEASHAIVDFQGRCTWLSKGFWRLITLSPPPYWPMDFLPASFPADLRSWIANSSQDWQELASWLRRSGQAMTLSRPRPDMRGTLEWRLSLLRGDPESHQDDYLWISLQDISSRQTDEFNQQEMVDRYQLALQGSFDGLWEWNLQTGHVWLSPRYHALMDCDAPLPGTTASLFDFIVEEDRTAVADQLGAYNQGKNPKFEVVCRVRHRNGDLRWFLIRAVNQRDEQGRLLRLVGSHTDITQLILAEQILLDAIEGIQDGFALFNTDDRLLLCNERYLEIYPYSRNLVPLIGRSFEEMLREGLRVGFFAEEMAQNNPEQWLAERLAFHRNPAGPPIEQRLSDGRWILIRERPTKDGGIVGIRSDITALKQREIELAELAERLAEEKKRAENANAAKTSFLATISHELRTPMTGVIGMLDLLRTTGLNTEQLHYAELLQRSAQSMMGLLNDMLDLSKIEAGRLDLELINLDLYHLVRDVIDLFRPRAEEKRIGIGYHFDRQVPSLIQGDPTRLRQILFNLVSNAVKFTESGSVQIRVDAAPATNQRMVLIFSVEDTGIGMSPEQIATIFEPFQQAELSTARRFGGSGLGLAICQKLVEAMQGQIEVKSQPGIGTTFRVEIMVDNAQENTVTPAITAPIVASALPIQAQSTPAPLGNPHPETARPLNILLAEDNQTTLLLVRSILDRRGHRVICVPNGKAALEAVQHNQIDLVLMDSHMPDMDGATATRMIRQLPAPQNTIPIYGLTADVMPEKLDQLRDAGMNGILSKPIDWGDLDRTLHLVSIGISPPKATATEDSAPVPSQDTAESSQETSGIKGIDPKKWAEMVDLLGNAEARGLCLHGILDAEEMVGQIGELLAENPHRPGKQGDYFRLVHTLEGLLGNIGALEWASLCHMLQEDEFTTHRLEWLDLIRDGLTNLYDSLQN